MSKTLQEVKEELFAIDWNFSQIVREILGIEYLDTPNDFITKIDNSFGDMCFSFYCCFISGVSHEESLKSEFRLKYANAPKISFTIFITNQLEELKPEFVVEPSIGWQFTDAGLEPPVIEKDTITEALKSLETWFKSNKELKIIVQETEEELRS